MPALLPDEGGSVLTQTKDPSPATLPVVCKEALIKFASAISRYFLLNIHKVSLFLYLSPFLMAGWISRRFISNQWQLSVIKVIFKNWNITSSYKFILSLCIRWLNLPPLTLSCCHISFRDGVLDIKCNEIFIKVPYKNLKVKRFGESNSAVQLLGCLMYGLVT